MLNTLSGSVQVLLAGEGANLLYMEEPFKARMKRLRLQAGYKSQADAAAAIGCERGTVGMWEAPSSAVASVGQYLLAVAKAYRVRPDFVETGTGSDGFPWTAATAPTLASQSAILDPGKLQLSSEFVDQQLEMWGVEATAEKRFLLIAAAYAHLTTESVPNRLDLSRRLMDLVAEKENVGQGKAGGPGSGDRGRNEGPAPKAKAAGRKKG